MYRFLFDFHVHVSFSHPIVSSMDLIKGLLFFAKFFMIQDSIFKLSGWENDRLNYSYTKCVEYLAEQCFDC